MADILDRIVADVVRRLGANPAPPDLEERARAAAAPRPAAGGPP